MKKKTLVTKRDLDEKFKELEMEIAFISVSDMRKKQQDFIKMRNVAKMAKDRIANDPSKQADLLTYIDIINHYSRCVALLQEAIEESDSFCSIDDLEIIY